MGRVVRVLGDDISTDVIYPGRYMATVLPSETPQFAFVDDKDLNIGLTSGRIPRGSVIVAGRNFGCGSSREQAVSALKGHDLIIVAQSVARIFMQNAINLGLRLITVPDFEASEGDELEVVEGGSSIVQRASALSRCNCRRRDRRSSKRAGSLRTPEGASLRPMANKWRIIREREL